VCLGTRWRPTVVDEGDGVGGHRHDVDLVDADGCLAGKMRSELGASLVVATVSVWAAR
jgi:hypothetical protein